MTTSMSQNESSALTREFKKAGDCFTILTARKADATYRPSRCCRPNNSCSVERVPRRLPQALSSSRQTTCYGGRMRLGNHVELSCPLPFYLLEWRRLEAADIFLSTCSLPHAARTRNRGQLTRSSQSCSRASVESLASVSDVAACRPARRRPRPARSCSDRTRRRCQQPGRHEHSPHVRVVVRVGKDRVR
jgi:hypothetical protein